MSKQKFSLKNAEQVRVTTTMAQQKQIKQSSGKYRQQDANTSPPQLLTVKSKIYHP